MTLTDVNSVSEITIAVSKVFDRGKVQIPAEIRKTLKLNDGDKIIWILRSGDYFIKPAQSRAFKI